MDGLESGHLAVAFLNNGTVFCPSVPLSCARAEAQLRLCAHVGRVDVYAMVTIRLIVMLS